MAPQPQKEDRYEGFAMVDDIYGPRTRISHYHLHRQQYHYQHSQHQTHLYQGPRVEVFTVREPVSYRYQWVPQVVKMEDDPAEPVIDSKQAAKLYGGIVIVDYGKRKPTHRVL